MTAIRHYIRGTMMREAMTRDTERPMEARYEHPQNGRYNETIATLADGRRMRVNTQYGTVSPLGDHEDGCSLTVQIGGRCDCGKLDGVDVDALLADARENGKRGPAAREEPETEPDPEPTRGPGWCNRCKSYCYGDCTAY